MKCWRCEGRGSISVDSDNGIGWVSCICPVCHGKGVQKISKSDVVLLIDVQNGFCNDFTNPVIAELSLFLKENNFEKVIATKFINYKESVFEKNLEYFKLLTYEEQKIVPEIFPYVSAVFLKDTYNCITDGLLEQIRIINNGLLPERVLIAGFDTESCVLVTATGLFDKGIKPYILVDFVASTEGTENHLCGLRAAETMFGVDSLIKLG